MLLRGGGLMGYAASISDPQGRGVRALAKILLYARPLSLFAWLLIIAGPFACAALWPEHLPAWGLMWTSAFTVYSGAKLLTWGSKTGYSPPARQIGYLFAWPGMDAIAFLRGPDRQVHRPRLGEWLFATAKMFLGVLFLFVATRLVPAEYPLAVSWVGMAGIVFVLHFGSFHLLSCAWRSVGIDAKPLMNWPILSQSVSEYWGRRWNRAFRDLAHRFLFQPLTNRFGVRWGLAAGFLFSGIVHDAVISLPAGGGYGLPTLFFVFQGAAMLLERSSFGKLLGLGVGWRGRAFTALSILGPAPLLFHPWFIQRIVLPFIQALGAVG